jgi:hypothetical protein
MGPVRRSHGRTALLPHNAEARRRARGMRTIRPLSADLVAECHIWHRLAPIARLVTVFLGLAFIDPL